MIGRNRKAKDKIWRKINSIGGKFLSKAGNEVMIKSVLQSIPSYIMSAYLLPKSTCEEIERMLNSYWWVKWLAWEKLTVRKEEGGRDEF